MEGNQQEKQEDLKTLAIKAGKALIVVVGGGLLGGLCVGYGMRQGQKLADKAPIKK